MQLEVEFQDKPFQRRICRGRSEMHVAFEILIDREKNDPETNEQLTPSVLMRHSGDIPSVLILERVQR
jgi:hypothetical protein